MLTLLLLFVLTEGGCRLIWTADDTEPCLIKDPLASTLGGYRPNCASRMKLAEGPWYEVKYNDCGYRNADSCGPKPPGSFRVVVVGSSVVNGPGVAYEETFIAQSSRDLSRACGRKIEVHNVGANANMLHLYRRTDDALVLDPDLVVLIFGSGDTHAVFDPVELANRDKPAVPTNLPPEMAQTLLHRFLRLIAHDSRAMLVAKHFAYRNPSLTLRAIAVQPQDSDYMMIPPPTAWTKRLADLDLLIGAMADKVRAHKIPFALLTNVGEPQVVLLNAHDPLPGFAPREFERTLSGIAQAHKIPMLDVYDDFAQKPYTELFYSADGHPSAEGHAVLSRGFVRELLSRGMIPGCNLDTPGATSQVSSLPASAQPSPSK
jgi:hypothetical protein